MEGQIDRPQRWVPALRWTARVWSVASVALVLAFIVGEGSHPSGDGSTGIPFAPAPSMGSLRGMLPPDCGYALWAVYAVWIAVIVMLYPACHWYAQLKQRRRDWWLS